MMPTYLYTLMSSRCGTELTWKKFKHEINLFEIVGKFNISLRTVFFEFWCLCCCRRQLVFGITHVTDATAKIHFLQRRCVNALGVHTCIVQKTTFHLNMTFAGDIICGP